ncbi:SpoIIE family protein phosphatase [Leptolyngbya sp. PCC 6406]|uniref:SpoIIE family protein phosphatase n=1 Tax=Leptolyngbya sp. PCC 6406 TaxID=1173264 RepID=UPI0002AC5A68|nr:SpoIIE family protein phosphatase [Leptolyngbya sp. PCC 6406]
MAWEDEESLKLMVVDDEPDNLDLLYRTFRREFQVFKAENGFKALELLDAEGEMAIIISDQRMPRMNGTEFLSRTVDRFPDTIRIVLTGYTDVEDLVEAINSGKVFKYITKPWNPEQLKTVVVQAAETYRVVKQRTKALTRSLRRESLSNEVMTAIRESLDYHSMLQTIANTLGHTFGAHYAILHAMPPAAESALADPALGKAFTYVVPGQSLDLRESLERHSWDVTQDVFLAGDHPQGPNCVHHQLDTLDDLPVPVVALTMPLIYQQTALAAVSLYQVAAEADWSEDTLVLLDSVTEQIALAISQARLYQRIQEQTMQMRAELEVARQIQSNLLRQTLPTLDTARIQARCFPAREVGGDFFEVFVHPQGDLWLAVGDVSGKGVPAALFMASAISVLRRELSQETPPTPEKMMQNLNHSLSEDLVGNNCFITLVLVRYTPSTHQLMYANAGHIYPLVWSPETLENPEAEPIYLEVRGVPLGILPIWKAAAGELTMPEGGTLLLASDGLTEATVQDKDNPGSTAMLRQTGLWELLKRQPRPLDLDKLLLTIQGEKTEQEDDQTVLALEVV